MYGHIDKFAAWIEHARGSAFFFSTYTESTREENEALKSELSDANLRFKTALPKSLLPGGITFIDTGPNTKHEDFVTQAWTQNPLTWILSHIPGYPKKIATPNTAHKPR
jgi:hypothetical protein